MPYLPGVPSIVTCYDLIPLIYPQYFTAIQRLIFRTAHFLALRASRVILAISQATKNDLVRFFRVDPQRIIVTPLAADAHFKPPAQAARDRVRQQYALPDRYVLYFGSNKPHKNMPRLIEAFARSDVKDQAGLVIAGQWDERYPQAKDLVKQLYLKEHVRFLGPVKDADLPALYCGAAVFVFPSEYEGFGLPVLEAMACGAPVVCGNRSSLPEVAGDAALLCDPHDPEALARAIEQTLTDRDLRTTLQQRGLARASQFSWEQTARQTLSTYRMLQLS
jgi:alpha-1,3-rhamnosyl/mannosyltransferase